MRRYKVLSGFTGPVIVIMLAMLVAVCFSCKPAKLTTTEKVSEKKGDSIVYKETVKFDTVRVKSESANISIPFYMLKDSLLNYMEKTNGRARVSIQRKGDTIYAEAHCDSLEKVIASKDKELNEWHRYAIEQNKTKTEVIIRLPLWFKLLIGGIILLQLITFLKPLFFKSPNLFGQTLLRSPSIKEQVAEALIEYLKHNPNQKLS